jgi:hypothetical protein
MKQSIFILLTAVLIAGCNNSADREQPREDTATAITESDPEGLELEAIQAAFPELYKHFSAADPSFSTDSFFLATTAPLETLEPQKLDTQRLRPFTPFLIFNSDSSRAIDMVSYNYEPVQKNGKSMFAEAGPDTEVSLIDFKKNTKQRILFLGTAAGIEDAKWTDNGEVLLAGWESHEGKIRPTIWKITPFTTMQVFSYTDTLNFRPYSKWKIPLD